MSAEALISILASPILATLVTVAVLKYTGFVRLEVEGALQAQRKEFEDLLKQLEFRRPVERVEALTPVVGAQHLEVHQELFSLALKMASTVCGDQKARSAVLAELDLFKHEKALYLKPKVLAALNEVTDYLSEIDSHRDELRSGDPEEKKAARENLLRSVRRVMEFPNVILLALDFEPWPFDTESYERLKKSVE